MESPSEESDDEAADSLRGQATYEPSDHGRGVHHKVPGKCPFRGGGGRLCFTVLDWQVDGAIGA